MAELEDKLPCLLREKLNKVGVASPDEKSGIEDLKRLDYLLAELLKVMLVWETLHKRLK